MFNILKVPLDCNYNHVIYLFEWKQCQYRFPFVGSTKTKFRYRINNYKYSSVPNGPNVREVYKAYNCVKKEKKCF